MIGLVGGKKSQEQLPANNNKGRKSKGYFLELNESEETKPDNGNQPAKAEAAKKPEPATANKPAKAEAAKKTKATEEKQAAKVELVQTAEGLKRQQQLLKQHLRLNTLPRRLPVQTVVVVLAQI